MTLQYLNKLKISRDNLEKLIRLSNFEEIIVGCFVRISIGLNSLTKKMVYRVAEIIGVVDNQKMYSFGSSQTKKGLKLRIVKQELISRMDFISNGDFNQQEFENWKENCARYKVVMPAVEFIRQKNKNIQSALGYKGIDYSVEELVDTNYGIKKAQLIKDRDAAILKRSREVSNDLKIGLLEPVDRAQKLKAPEKHPPIRDMVFNAIEKLKEPNGSSLQTIKKFLVTEYKVDVVKMAPFIKKNIKSAVAKGQLWQTKGKGASGSFKLPEKAEPKNEPKNVFTEDEFSVLMKIVKQDESTPIEKSILGEAMNQIKGIICEVKKHFPSKP